ncbi:hypothetical protein [Arcobacter sp. L]|uniref:hypothetical protein n=1 Tax=Arcobacter sp. L TaxID=944547 RepID=UPI00022964E4|nr:hypothetical protein [Arcobacter sp. L]BAK73193.1 hypothetical protein ABLL_1318 [Arcobacter sp. L]
MFQKIDLSLDFKDLEMIKNALENEIEYLEKQNFADVEKENIDEHKQLLKTIDNSLNKIMEGK